MNENKKPYHETLADEFITNNHLIVSGQDREAIAYFLYLMLNAGSEGVDSDFYKNLNYNHPPFTDHKYVVCKFPIFKKYLEDNIMEYAYDMGRPLNVANASGLLKEVKNMCS